MPPTKRTYTKKISSEKKDPYLVYKLLDSFLLNPTDKVLDTICSNPTESKKAKNRALIQLEAFPDIINKINIYANQTPERCRILSKLTDRDWLVYFSKLISNLNLSTYRSFYKPKFQVHEYGEFSKKIKEYYDQIDEIPSAQEIQSLFILYKEGIIPKELIESVTETGEVENNKSKSTTKSSLITMPNLGQLNPAINSCKEDHTIDTLGPGVKEFIEQFTNYTKTCKECRSCEGHKNRKILIDTSEQYLNPQTQVDVLFVGLHPLYEDTEKGIPYSGNNTSIVRDLIDVLMSRYSCTFSWAIINLLSCTFSNDKDFKAEACINKCQGIFTVLRSHLNPKVIVTFGDKVMKHFGIKGTMSKNNAQVFTDPKYPNTLIIPTVDIINMSTRARNSFDKAINTLINVLDENTIKHTMSVNPEMKYNIPDNKVVKTLTDDYTIIDIKELDNKLLYIIKDKNTNIKKYYFEEIKVPVYIKFGNYKECHMITDEMDQIIYLNQFELSQLNKKLYQDMQSLTK